MKLIMAVLGSRGTDLSLCSVHQGVSTNLGTVVHQLPSPCLPSPKPVCPRHTPQVEKCWLITRTGVAVELLPSLDELPATQATVQPQTGDRVAPGTRATGSKGGAKMSQEVRGCLGWLPAQHRLWQGRRAQAW